ncbi:hypothetical protein CMUS01_16795 [Colletotrichum musicola]|uniref:Uncharacterized protein n=1 Tax=Colletotrichum musicola TaxID=2175873 RepID=A0A8H6IJJ9_9PEZI|nr:hypothetical protein CMUS01_16795 [Colletotrichum musicola]
MYNQKSWRLAGASGKVVDIWYPDNKTTVDKFIEQWSDELRKACEAALFGSRESILSTRESSRRREYERTNNRRAKDRRARKPGLRAVQNGQEATSGNTTPGPFLGSLPVEVVVGEDALGSGSVDLVSPTLLDVGTGGLFNFDLDLDLDIDRMAASIVDCGVFDFSAVASVPLSLDTVDPVSPTTIGNAFDLDMSYSSWCSPLGDCDFGVEFQL